MNDETKKLPWRRFLSTAMLLLFVAAIFVWIDWDLIFNKFEPDDKTPWDEADAINKIVRPMLLVISIGCTGPVLHVIWIVCIGRKNKKKVDKWEPP